jgi:hypothetical protein
MAEATGHATKQEPDPWLQRTRSSRAREALVFVLYYFLTALLYTNIFSALLDAEMTWNFQQLLAMFLAFAAPFEFWLWYRAGARYQRISRLRTIALGIAMVTIPCAVITVMSFGLAILFVVFMLPPALPIGIALVWLYIRLRDKKIRASELRNGGVPS